MAELIGVIASIASLVQITTLLGSGGYGYISSFKAAREEIQQLCSELKALHEVLQKLNTHPVYSQPMANSAINEQLKTCLTELQILQKKLPPRKGKLGLYNRLMWPLKSKETEEFLSRINRYNCLFTLALTADQHCVLLAVKAFSQHTDTAVTDLVEQLRKQFLAWEVHKKEEAALREGESRTRLYKWLYPYPVNERHIEISRRRQEYTGEWLLRNRGYKDWQQGGSLIRIIWGHGIPGAGKTFLSSLVIDQLEAQRSKANHAVSYIYFNYNEQDQQTPLHVLSSLIAQLVAQMPEIPQEVNSLYKRLQPNNRPTFEDLRGTLLAICQHFHRTFFIFDALDEAHERNQRKDLLPIFHELAQNGASLLLTGRPYSQDINQSLTGEAVTKIELSAQEEDVKIYVEETITGHPQANAFIHGQLRDRLVEKLVDCCKGMFLVVHLHIQDLCQHTTPNQVRTALKALNDSLRTDRPLNGIYNRVIENIYIQHTNRVNLAQKILMWLVKARRILTIDELRVAVSLEEDSSDLPSEEDMPSASMLVEVCAGLVTIDKASNTVRLAHYSVQEYLVGHSWISGAEMVIATACMSYLSNETFRVNPRLDDSRRLVESLVKSHPLLYYVTLFFDSHLQACDELSSIKVYLQFLKDSPTLRFYQLAHDVFRKEKGHRQQMDARLRYIEFSRLISPFIDWCSDIGTTHVRDASPLLEASRIGHYTVVNQLLEEGFDVEAKGYYNETPIHMAAAMGHLNIAQALVKKGCVLTSPGLLAMTPLEVAVSEEQQPMVQFLIESGALTKPSSEYEQIPLQIAASHGSESIVRILLGAGVNVNATDDNGKTALALAALNRLGSMIRLLIGAGATPFADYYGNTPLHRMASNRFSEPSETADVVQSLLDAGVDILAVNKAGKTALDTAKLVGNHHLSNLLQSLEVSTRIQAVQDTRKESDAPSGCHNLLPLEIN